MLSGSMNGTARAAEPAPEVRIYAPAESKPARVEEHGNAPEPPESESTTVTPPTVREALETFRDRCGAVPPRAVLLRTLERTVSMRGWNGEDRSSLYGLIAVARDFLSIIGGPSSMDEAMFHEARGLLAFIEAQALGSPTWQTRPSEDKDVIAVHEIVSGPIIRAGVALYRAVPDELHEMVTDDLVYALGEVA